MRHSLDGAAGPPARLPDITTISVGNGHDTAFWHDCWLINMPLAERFPSLFSHLAGRAGSVHDVATADLRVLFQRRLTAQTTDELQLLQGLLHDVSLDDSRDKRVSFFEDGERPRAVITSVPPSSLSGEILHHQE